MVSNFKLQSIFKDIDLSYISAITFNAFSRGAGSAVALHLDAPDGKKVGEVKVSPNEGNRNFTEVTTEIVPAKGIYDLYFVFKKEGEGE